MLLYLGAIIPMENPENTVHVYEVIFQKKEGLSTNQEQSIYRWYNN